MSASAPPPGDTPVKRLAWRLGLLTQFLFFLALFCGLLAAWFLGAETTDFRYAGF